MKKIWIAIFYLSLLQGCASQIQAVDGYMSAAAISARASEDLHLKALKFNLCATPFSAVVRNQEYAGALKSLCLGDDSTTASQLLDEVKK